MSGFGSNLFSWKSKAEMEAEHERYRIWAFPYGQKQRDNLQALLLDIFPKGSDATTLIPFLTCKELYDNALKNNSEREEAIFTIVNKERRLMQLVKKKDMPLYVALVIADAEVDERCQYPTADEIRASALEIEKLLRSN